MSTTSLALDVINVDVSFLIEYSTLKIGKLHKENF